MITLAGTAPDLRPARSPPAAGKAELTGQIRSFMTWLGEGRKLTQAGRIGLADARQLAELLGTGDTIEQASSRHGELVDRARHGHERVVLTEHGQPAAVLISVDELDDEFMASLDLDVTP